MFWHLMQRTFNVYCCSLQDQVAWTAARVRLPEGTPVMRRSAQGALDGAKAHAQSLTDHGTFRATRHSWASTARLSALPWAFGNALLFDSISLAFVDRARTIQACCFLFESIRGTDTPSE